MDLGLLYNLDEDAGLPGQGAMLGLNLGRRFRGDFPLLEVTPVSSPS